MSETEQPLSTEEKEAIYDYLNKSGAAPNPEEKHNTHTFLFNVAVASDTTKTGYLKEDEVGIPHHPTRALKNFALISEKIINNDYFKEYFEKQSEIVTATSLSRDGFLVKQAVTQTKQIADVTKQRKENKGWFKKKESEEDKELTR